MARPHYNLGVVIGRRGKLEEAMRHYTEALRIEPDHAEAHNNLAVALAGQGRLKEAISHYPETLRIKPDYAEARGNLERALTLMEESVVNSNTVAKPYGVFHPGRRP